MVRDKRPPRKETFNNLDHQDPKITWNGVCLSFPPKKQPTTCPKQMHDMLPPNPNSKSRFPTRKQTLILL